MNNILIFSRYGPLGASSRVRSLQYLPYFRSMDVKVTVKPLLSDAYLQALYKGRSRWREVVKGYAGRVHALLGAKRFDVVIIEKELFPFMPATVEKCLQLIGVPYVVDFDDALFHRYDCHTNYWIRRLLGQKIDKVMRYSALVIAGNNYLAERGKQVGAGKVEIIPTVVDADRYQPKQKIAGEVPVVGWIGTPQTSNYMKPLLPVFESIQKKMPVRFVAVGARAEDFKDTPVETIPWSETTEVESIQAFDIGIMPLKDSPWERGKCGYKLIQYMACGIPVLASPVGVNYTIIKQGSNGFLANSLEEWSGALEKLICMSLDERQAMGKKGRQEVKDWYSLEAQAPRLLSLIQKVNVKTSV